MRRCLPAALTGLALLGLLTACTGKDVGDQNRSNFHYTSSTKLGTVIAVDKRKAAGDFTLPELTGSTSVDVSSLRGRVVLVNFWASWCPPCKGEAPQLDLVYRQFKPRGFIILGVDTKDLKQNARSFVQDNDISYPNVYDANGESALKIGKLPVAGLPISVLIDKHGDVAAVYTIRLYPADLKPVLVALLNGR